MARGKTLEDILNSVRAEARLSLLPAHNVQTRDSHILLIQREQERLWGDFAWPHLRVRRFIQLQSGQRTYSVPSDLSIDRIESIQVKDGDTWCDVYPDIPDECFSTYDSDLDERSWPVRNWRADENDDIEVWPIPDQNGTSSTRDGYLKVTGIRNLRPLVADADTADLDDRLLALYCAGTILAATGARDAELKLEAANRHYGDLKAKQVKRNKVKAFQTGHRVMRTRRPYINKYVP